MPRADLSEHFTYHDYNNPIQALGVYNIKVNDLFFSGTVLSLVEKFKILV